MTDVRQQVLRDATSDYNWRVELIGLKDVVLVFLVLLRSSTRLRRPPVLQKNKIEIKYVKFMSPSTSPAVPISRKAPYSLWPSVGNWWIANTPSPLPNAHVSRQHPLVTHLRMAAQKKEINNSLEAEGIARRPFPPMNHSQTDENWLRYQGRGRDLRIFGHAFFQDQTALTLSIVNLTAVTATTSAAATSPAPHQRFLRGPTQQPEKGSVPKVNK